MIGLAASATMTDYFVYQDAEAAAAVTGREQFNGDVSVKTTWEIEPVRDVLALERLPQGWDGYGSPRISRTAVNMTIVLLGQVADLGFDNLPRPIVGPIAAGGVTLEFEVGRRELCVAVYNDLSMTYLKSEEGEPFEGDSITLWSTGRLRELVSWLTAAG